MKGDLGMAMKNGYISAFSRNIYEAISILSEISAHFFYIGLKGV
jgi:hypothetical protein